jgi:hypothetical protein
MYGKYTHLTLSDIYLFALLFKNFEILYLKRAQLSIQRHVRYVILSKQHCYQF